MIIVSDQRGWRAAIFSHFAHVFGTERSVNTFNTRSVVVAILEFYIYDGTKKMHVIR